MALERKEEEIAELKEKLEMMEKCREDKKEDVVEHVKGGVDLKVMREDTDGKKSEE